MSGQPYHQRLLRLLLSLRLLRHPRQPVHQQRRTNVEDDESPHDPKVPPPMAILYVEAREQEFIGGCESAKPASRRGVRELEVAASKGNVLLEELTAGLAGWWIDSDIFDVGTNDGTPAEGCSSKRK